MIPSSVMNTGDQHKESSLAAEVQLLRLVVLTSTLLTLVGCFLGQNIEATINAARLYGFVLLLLFSTATACRMTKSLEAGILIVAIYLGSALWLGNSWMIIPLVLASFFFWQKTGMAHVLRFIGCFDSWIISGLATGLILSVTHYGDFLILEKLRQGLLHKDTLFHASIASMIKTYGISSTGLHGLVELHYHVLSHRMFAAVSLLSGVHVLETYGILPIIFLGPLLIAATTWCAFRLSGEASSQAIREKWMIVCSALALLKVLPLEHWAVWDDYFVSESYTLSLVLLLLAIPYIVIPTPGWRGMLLACTLGLLAGLSKGSVGIFAMSLLWVRAILNPGTFGRDRSILITALTTAVFVYFMSSAAQYASSRTRFDPFFYVQKESYWGAELREALAELTAWRIPSPGLGIKAMAAVLLYLTFNYAFSWLVVLRDYLTVGGKAMLREPATLYTVAALGVSLSTLAFAVSGGDWYFVNPPMFVALPFFVVAVRGYLTRYPQIAGRLMRGLAAFCLTFSLYLNYGEQGGGAFTKSPNGLIESRRDTADNFETLFALRDSGYGGQVIFARGNGMPHPNAGWDGDRVPFLYPAVTERAWIGVIEPESNSVYWNYSYPRYLKGSPRRLVPPVIPKGARVVLVPIQQRS